MNFDYMNGSFNDLKENIRTTHLQNMYDVNLFHYTNLESLINILKTNTLWATNCEYLNDLLELTDFEKIFDELLTESFNELLIKDIDKFCKFINLFKKNIFEKWLKKFRKQTYIISFSTHNDSVAMWNNYGKNGVVLEFESQSMINTVNTEKIYIVDKTNDIKEIYVIKRFGEVFYHTSDIKKVFFLTFEALIKKHELNNPKREEELTDFIFDILLDFSIAVYFQKKNINFSYENEFRMVFALKDEDVGKVENFRTKNNLIIPFISIKFNPKSPLPLKSITINPEQKDCMYEKGIQHLLNAYGYDIPIKHSIHKIR